MSEEPAAPAPLRRAVAAAAQLLTPISFTLPGPERDAREDLLADLRARLQGYLRPRLDDAGAPVLTALAGASGAGKSTLLNTLAGSCVSDTGVLRPTTDRPVLWAHPAHVPRQRARVEAAGITRPEVVRADGSLAAATSVLDLPGIGSDVPGHGAAVDAGLRAADMCVFVASGERYADAAAWDVLRRIRDAGLPLAVVLDRVVAAGVDEIRGDLERRLEAAGIEPATVPPALTIVERDGGVPGGALPDEDVAGLRARLEALGDPLHREQVVGRAVAGAAVIAARDLRLVADEIRSEREAATALASIASAIYSRSRDHLVERLRTSGLLDPDRLPGGDRQDRREGVVGQLAAAVVAVAEQAARAVAAAWEEDRVGRVLLDDAEASLRDHAPQLMLRASARVRRWLDGLAPADPATAMEIGAAEVTEILTDLLAEDRDRFLDVIGPAAGEGPAPTGTFERVADGLEDAARQMAASLPAGPPAPSAGADRGGGGADG